MHTLLRERIRNHEWISVLLSFVYFFCILSAYYVMRPIREQLSAQVGSDQLPWFFAATFATTLVLTPFFAWSVSRWPRHIVVPFVYLFFIGCQFAFFPFFTHEGLLSAKTLGMLFFVWVSVFNLFVVSVFWSFMTDIWNDEQAKRLFPIIAIGGTLGAVMGPLITRNLVGSIGVGYLLLVSASLLACAVICVVYLGVWARSYGAHRKDKKGEAPIGGGMLDGLKQIFSSPFVANMAILMVLGDAIGTIGYVLITDYSSVTFPGDAIARTRFAANIDLSANVIQIIVQLTLTRWLLMRYGASTVFVVWSLIVASTCLLLYVVEDPYAPLVRSMPMVAIILIMSRALSYGMLAPAKETLFTLVPRDIRYKGKNAVDTVVWRAGDIASLLMITRFKALGLGIRGFGVVGALLIIVSGFVGWRLARSVENPNYTRLSDD